MLCHTAWLITRLDLTKYIFERPLLERIAKWQVLLSEYDIQYISQKAIKESAMVEFFADRASKDYELIDFDFSDEDLMIVSHDEEESSNKTYWKLYFDRASNVLGHGIGVVLITPKGEYCPFTTRLDFNCTNNVEEYEACAMGLQAVIDKGVKQLEVYEDSVLVIYQLQGEWETRDFRLILYHKHIIEMIKQFNEIDFNHSFEKKSNGKRVGHVSRHVSS